MVTPVPLSTSFPKSGREPMNEQDLQRILARLDLLETRHFDNKERILKVETYFRDIEERRLDLKATLASIDLRLKTIEDQMNSARGGWRVLVTVGGIVGFLLAVAMDAFRTLFHWL